MKQHVKMIEGIKYNNVCIKESDLESYKIFPIENHFVYDGIRCGFDSDASRYEICFDNHFIVKRENFYGALNTKGDEVIPCMWRNLFWLLNGLFKVDTSDGFQQVINLKNELVDQNEYCDIIPYAEKYLVCDAYSELWGMRDQKWNLVIDMIYQTQEEVEELFQLTTGKYYLCNNLERAENIGDYRVSLDSEIVRIPFATDDPVETTKLFYSPDFDEYFSSNIPCYESKIGFKDGNGHIVIDPFFDEVTPFSNGFAGVGLYRQKNPTMVYSDMTGKATYLIDEIPDLTQDDLNNEICDDVSYDDLEKSRVGIIDIYGNYITNGIYQFDSVNKVTIRYTHMINENGMYRLVPASKVYGIEASDNTVLWYDNYDECLKVYETFQNIEPMEINLKIKRLVL